MVILRQQAALAAAILAAGAAPQPAAAGAWTREQGRTAIIFTGLALDAARRFDRRGRPLRADRFSKQEARAEAEHGLTDAVTLIAGARLQHLGVEAAAGARHTATGSVLVGARARLWAGGATSLAVQGTLRAGGERSLPTALLAMEAPVEADLRLAAGHGFALGAWPAFAEAQIGYRWRGGRHADEAHLDLTLGVRPMPNWLLLLQSLNAVAAERDQRYGGGRLRRHKLQPSLVWDLSERWSVQVGVFASVGGRETIRERGVVGAVWWRF